jgi:hypothetical protein
MMKIKERFGKQTQNKRKVEQKAIYPNSCDRKITPTLIKVTSS